MICTSEWMPVTLGGSHAGYKLCRKELVDSSSSQSLLAKLLELVSSLNLAIEDFAWFPFPSRKKKRNKWQSY